jgi:hypothetical protein
MPAALPANTTPRIVLRYTSFLIEHTLTLRFQVDALAAGCLAAAVALANALTPFMFATDSFTGADFIATGSDFSIPQTFTSIAGTFVGANWAEDPESAFVSVTARSSGGHKVRWDLFTAAQFFAPWPATNRVSASADAAAAVLVDAFVDACSDEDEPLTAIDGLPTTPHQYVNIAKNGYWQRKQR